MQASQPSDLTWRGAVARRYRPRRWMSQEWRSQTLWVRGHPWLIVSRRGYGVTLWAFSHLGVQVRLWPRLSWYGDLLMVKRKKASAEGQTVSHLAPMETNVLARCQALVEHCAATQYDDGEARRPGWFTVRTRGAAWEIELKDPDTCSRLVVIQQSLDDALALAQILLESEEAPWERDPWLAQAAGRQKKK